MIGQVEYWVVWVPIEISVRRSGRGHNLKSPTHNEISTWVIKIEVAHIKIKKSPRRDFKKNVQSICKEMRYVA